MTARPSQRASANASGYRSDIDGIRGLAVCSVVLFHAGVPLFAGGFTGVDIFFVLSGYLIGGHIFSELSIGTFSFARFYQRRAKRILPAFYAVLAAVLLSGLLLLAPQELRQLGPNAIAALLSISNIHFLRYANYFQQSSELNPLLMTWSLAVEEQFYVVIPLVMVLVARVRRNAILPAILIVCVASFLIAWRQVHVSPDHAFYLLPSRAWELGAGVSLGVAEALRNSSLVPPKLVSVVGACGGAAMVLPLFLLNASTPFPGPSAAFTVVGTALVLACRTGWLNRTLLSEPRLVFLGKISYSWYLWHWPLLAFLRMATGGPLPATARACVVVLSLALAVASYYCIEQPFRRSTMAPLPLLVRYAGVAIAMAAVFAAVWRSGGLPARYPALHPEQAEAPAACLAAYGDSQPKLSRPCYAADDQRSTVALWGDSHSSALAPALRSEVTQHGQQFAEFSKSSCLPLEDVAKSVASHPSLVQECIHFNRVVLQTILGDNNIRTVILAGRWADPFVADFATPLFYSDQATGDRARPAASEADALAAGLNKPIAALQAAGRRIILIQDVPNFDFDPICTMLSAQIPLRRKLATWLSARPYTPGFAHPSYLYATLRSNTVLNKVRTEHSDVRLLDLRPQFCEEAGLCAYTHQGQMLYADGQHLTAKGAFYALRGVTLVTPP